MKPETAPKRYPILNTYVNALSMDETVDYVKRGVLKVGFYDLRAVFADFCAFAAERAFFGVERELRLSSYALGIMTPDAGQRTAL